MKKTLLILALSIWLGLSGCYKYVAEHPEKTEKELKEDQAVCEKQARDYVDSRLHAHVRREELAGNDENAYTRRCMQSLGWEYHLRKAGD